MHKEEIKGDNITKPYKNDWFWWNYKRKDKRTSPNLVTNSWSSIKKLIIWDSIPAKNAFFNLITYRLDIDKSYLYSKDPY